MYATNKPIIVIDEESLSRSGVEIGEIRKYFPRCILNPTILPYGRVKHAFFFVVRMFLTVLVKLILRPRKSSGVLDNAEVEAVYDKEARTYDRKHHITTRGMDLVWRRSCGWFISTIGRNKSREISVLDICSGTGLTVKEMASISREWGIKVEFHALDYNTRMLEVAGENIGLVDAHVLLCQENAMDMKGISTSCFDVTTQMFGIGGIEKPQMVFAEVLRTLKPEGKFLLIDMHKPIPEYPGEWPFLLRWFRFPVLESVVYERSTLPIILKRLWGWRDTTLCFYFLPLATWKDEDGRNWGFNVCYFNQESKRWWFALPIMPTAKIVVEKVEISAEEAEKRKTILECCTQRPID